MKLVGLDSPKIQNNLTKEHSSGKQIEKKNVRKRNSLFLSYSGLLIKLSFLLFPRRELLRRVYPVQTPSLPFPQSNRQDTSGSYV